MFWRPTASLFLTAAVVVWGCLLLMLLPGCNRPEPAADNILFVTFDTTRADHLSAYGYDKPTSPVLEGLADRGALFENAFTHVTSTLPAHSSMFTGLLPPRTGVRCNGKFALSPQRTTLAELLSAAGFATGAVVAAFPLDARFGLAQGFAHYDADFSGSAVTARRRKGRMDDPGFWIGHEFVDFERSAAEVSDAAIAWLKQNAAARQRWFLFAHYFDAHWPYEPLPEDAARFDSAYDAEIAAADRELGRLLAFVDSLPGRTLIVFTADHGEGLGDHGEAMHNRFVYNSTLHVPLLIALEGVVEPRRRIHTNVGHVDLFPTVLDLLGLDKPGGLDGRSLAPVLGAGAGEPPLRPHYSETLVWSLERPHGIELRSIIEGDFKLVHTQIDGAEGRTEQLELYDISFDRAELTDLARVDPQHLQSLKADLEHWRVRLEQHAAPVSPIEMDEGARQRLRSLGYL